MKSAEESRRKKLVRKLEKVFVRLDKDGSGDVSHDELMTLTDEDNAMLHQLLGTHDPMRIFAALDVDDSGTINRDEFIDGIWQVAISNAPIETKRMEMQVD